MADEKQLAILRRGVEAWNDWRQRNPTIAYPDLREAHLVGANLAGTYDGANLVGANLDRANLDGAHLDRARLDDASLNGANLNGARLVYASLDDVRLDGANLDRANLNRASLNGAYLDEASLVDANLDNSHLIGARLVDARLDGANLNGAYLVGANLDRASLIGATLVDASLDDASLDDVRLDGANLDRARLIQARLINVSLVYARLYHARMFKTVLADIDLSQCEGLEECQHDGPSIIDHRTLRRSGPLPLTFLRGVGLPDNLIDYLPSVLNQAIRMYSCFISYSAKDDEFAQRLHADLQAKGVRCWFAPHDLPIGAKILDSIDEAIRLREKLLLILSENAIASDWVEDEVTKAFAEERRREQTVLFPIRLDEAVFKTDEAWAVKLKDNRNIGDFTRWKEHDAYTKALERLLRDLKVATPEAS